MRVVAGIARGHHLRAPKGDRTRPTSDFVREAVFATLGSLGGVAGADVIDLFAGTGALGIEALSRGSASCLFVDEDRRAVEAIRHNLASTGLEGGAVVRNEVLRHLATQPSSVSWDLAFADPPYAFDAWLDLAGVMAADLLVAESDRPVNLGGQWEVLKVKRYGDSVVTIASQRRCT